MSEHKVTGTFTGTGQSAPLEVYRGGNAVVWGTFVGTVKIECSYDNKATWLPISKNTNGDEAAFNAPFNLSFDEPERDVFYRLNCTAYVSGTINYRISGDLA
jgi:hypothetical protein